MRDVGFHNSNHISSEIQDIKNNIEHMQEAQLSVLTAIEENQTMMTQVVNHIGNTYHDGRSNFLPPRYINDKNQPPSKQTANSTISSQISEMTKVLRNLANKIKMIKSTMSKLQQQPVYQLYRPFNPNFQPRRHACGRHGGGRCCERFGNGRGNGGDNGREGGRGREYQQQRPPHTDTSQYCHTHGACGHSSFLYNHPNEGYKYNVTFENKMGGSTYYCE